MSVLHSTQIEKHTLAGLIQNQDLFAEIESLISDADYVSQTHSVIFRCIKLSFLANEKIDSVCLAQKIKNLGISFKDNIVIFDYIDALAHIPVSKAATIAACVELAKFKALRDIDTSCNTIKDYVSNNINQDLTTTVSQIDNIFNEKINSFEPNSEPEILFSDVYEDIEERGNNPPEEVGISTPFKEFNRMYGGLRAGNLYAIASRMSEGKTTFLAYLACEISRIHNIPVLFLDTEMSKTEMKYRGAASFSGVPLYYLEKGLWRNNGDMVKKVRTKTKELKNIYNKVYHYHVGNKHSDQLSSIINRWYLKIVGRGNRCVVFYDYLKLTVEKVSHNWAEHQILGEKIDKLKRVSIQIDNPVFTAIQLNRTGINTNRNSKDVIDDASAIALSDRLAWFATYVGIFRRKTEDEILLDTPESGEHCLIEIKARFQGINAAGHRDRILRQFPDGRKEYMRNYINFQISNFEVQECGSLKDSIARQNVKFLVIDEKSEEVKQHEVTL